MRKTQIVILLIIMQIVNIAYARANERYLTEEQKMMYEKVIKPEWRERGEAYIPEELQRYADIFSERAGRTIRQNHAVYYLYRKSMVFPNIMLYEL